MKNISDSEAVQEAERVGGDSLRVWLENPDGDGLVLRISVSLHAAMARRGESSFIAEELRALLETLADECGALRGTILARLTGQADYRQNRDET